MGAATMTCCPPGLKYNSIGGNLQTALHARAYPRSGTTVTMTTTTHADTRAAADPVVKGMEPQGSVLRGLPAYPVVKGMEPSGSVLRGMPRLTTTLSCWFAIVPCPVGVRQNSLRYDSVTVHGNGNVVTRPGRYVQAWSAGANIEPAIIDYLWSMDTTST